MEAEATQSQQESQPQVVPPGEFKEMPMPVRSFGNLSASRYKVYKSKSEFVAVEASTAVEAMRLSGVTEPDRIVRHVPGREVLIGVKRMLE